MGAVWAWPYHTDDAKHTIIERMETRGEFARGVGFGLARIAYSIFQPRRKNNA